VTTRRRHAAEPQTTPEGWPIRETRFGRFYQVPGEKCWREVERPTEERIAKMYGRRREGPHRADTSFNIFD
jgi:hypothetical protein